MSKPRNVAIEEGLWARLKQRALDERVTLKEVVARACHGYLGEAVSAPVRFAVTRRDDGMGQPPGMIEDTRPAGERRYERDEFSQ